MDTPEDQALHDRVVATHRAAAGSISTALGLATGAHP